MVCMKYRCIFEYAYSSNISLSSSYLIQTDYDAVARMLSFPKYESVRITVSYTRNVRYI